MSVNPPIPAPPIKNQTFSKKIPPAVWDDLPQEGAYFSRDKNNSCSCGSCSWFDRATSCDENDYPIDWDTCCGGLCRQTLKCLPPQKKVCSVSDTNDEFVAASWSSVNHSEVTEHPDLICTFDKTKFTPESLVAYRKKFGKDSKYLEILTMLASRPAKTRCLNPVCQTSADGSSTNCSSSTSTDGSGDAIVKKCSSLSEDSHDGFLLRRELGFCSDSEKMEIVKTVCGKTADFDDCRCFNKLIVDTNYALLKSFHNYDDRCWYLPCVDSYSLSHYTEPKDVPTSCPTNMCQVIIDAARNKNVDISKIQNTLNCSFDDKKQLLPPPTPPSQKYPTESIGGGGGAGKFLVFGLGLLFLFLFLIFVAAASSSSFSS